MLARGFAAGALAHLLCQGALGALLYAAGLRDQPVWSLAPVGPLGVPTTANAMFWDGLWGLLYAAIEPGLARRAGRIGGGLALGAASLALYWFVVLPLKGLGLGGGFAFGPTLDAMLFDAVFGIGTAFIFAALPRFSLRGRAIPV